MECRLNPHAACATNSSVCLCEEGYVGPNCSQPYQSPATAQIKIGTPGSTANSSTALRPARNVASSRLAVPGQVCSGHGTWNAATGRCTCVDPFRGKFCDNMDCPATVALIGGGPLNSSPQRVDDADCSNGRGLCQEGRCFCKPEFFGPSCSHARCPNECSGNGQCFQTPPAPVGDRVAGLGDQVGNASVDLDAAASNNSAPLSFWEGCVCDPGFTGVECELRVHDTQNR